MRYWLATKEIHNPIQAKRMEVDGPIQRNTDHPASEQYMHFSQEHLLRIWKEKEHGLREYPNKPHRDTIQSSCGNGRSHLR